MSNSNAPADVLPALDKADTVENRQKAERARLALLRSQAQRENQEAKRLLPPYSKKDRSALNKLRGASQTIKPWDVNRNTGSQGFQEANLPVNKRKNTIVSPEEPKNKRRKYTSTRVNLPLKSLLYIFVGLFLHEARIKMPVINKGKVPTMKELTAALEEAMQEIQDAKVRCSQQGQQIQKNHEYVAGLMQALKFPGDVDSVKQFKQYVDDLVTAYTTAVREMEMADQKHHQTAVAKKQDSDSSKLLMKELKKAQEDLAQVTEENDQLKRNLEKSKAKVETHAKTIREYMTQRKETRPKLKELEENLEGAKNQIRLLEDMLKKATESGPSETTEEATTTNASARVKSLKKAVDVLSQEKVNQEERIQKLTLCLQECHDELKRAGKAAKHQINTDTMKEAKSYIKEYHFFLVQFVDKDKSDRVMKKLSKPIYDALKDQLQFVDLKSEHYLQVEDFHRIYHHGLMAYLNDLRCNMASNLMKLVFSYNAIYQGIPTVKQLQGVWDLDLNDEGNKSLFTWYLKCWLPTLVGPGFDDVVRLNHKLVDKGQVVGRVRTYVTSQIEAFGWLMYENYHPKWNAICEEKQANPNFRPPKSFNKKKDHPSLEKFTKCKWSSSVAGQGKGWNKQVYQALKVHKAAIDKIREEDKKAGWTKMKNALEVLRLDEGLEEGIPYVPARYKRKRKSCTESSEEDFEDLYDESSEEELDKDWEHEE